MSTGGSRLSRSLSRVGRRRGSCAPLSEINVTPFVDVMLVLLIVFMLTAPMFTVGVSVDLPAVKAGQLATNESPLIVTVNDQGDVFLGDSKVRLDEIASTLLSLGETNREKRVYVRGDAKVDYGIVVQVMGILSESGFHRLSLITQSDN